jgi:hypothetical protein
MDALIPYIQVVLKVFVAVMQRYQSGYRFSTQEKIELLDGLSRLCTQFFSTYMVNVQLGETRMEISARDNVCLSKQPGLEDQDSVQEVF